MNDIFIKKNDSIKTALKKLDITAEKVLLVKNGRDQIIGALSDGDTRRALLHGADIEHSIENFYCRDFIFVEEDLFTEKELKALFLKYKIALIPVLKNDNTLSRVMTWDQVFKEDKDSRDNLKEKRTIDVPVVIMAGGKGTRLSPFTNVLPKPLIPIGDKTVIERIIDQFLPFGVKEFYLTLNYKGELIKAYLEGVEKEYTLHYVWEKEFTGTAGSVRRIEDKVTGDFIVSNCDITLAVDFAEVLHFHRESESFLTLISSIQHHRIPYGVVEFESGGKVTGIKEKPEYSVPINTGVYILSKECIPLIPENTVFHMTHLIEKLLKEGKKVSTFPVNERDYSDIGQWEEYQKVIMEYLKKTNNTV